MIFSCWGTPLTPLAYCGKHERKAYPAPMMLVRVRFNYPDMAPETGYVYAHTLKADGGLNEIEDAIADLPEVELAGAELQEALRDAE